MNWPRGGMEGDRMATPQAPPGASQVATLQELEKVQRQVQQQMDVIQQQRQNELVQKIQNVLADIANLAIAFSLADVVKIVEEVDGGKELVSNIRKLLKDFKELQDFLLSQAPSRSQGQAQSQQGTQNTKPQQ